MNFQLPLISAELARCNIASLSLRSRQTVAKNPEHTWQQPIRFPATSFCPIR